MSKTVTVEVCANGTITRANARALNRVLRTQFSGSTLAADAQVACACAGVRVRVVAAAALAGKDKAAHTREVTRSRTAQVKRAEAKLAAAVAA